MELVTDRRGDYKKMEYIDEGRVLLQYDIPLAEILVDFYDQLKSRTQGYASLDYTLAGMRPGDLVKLDVLVNNQPVDALSLITHRDKAQPQGRAAGGEAAQPDPPPAVRGADPGRDRQPHHRPRDGPGDAQERPRQVLRRRHHPQAKAAGETKEGQRAPTTR